MAALVVLLVAAGIYGAWLLWLQPEDIYASPETVELPPLPDDLAETRNYLAGEDGGQIRDVLSMTEPLLSAESAADCEQVVSSLDTAGTPAALLAAIAGVPDQATADMATNHLAAVARFAGECLETGSAPASDEIRFTHVVLARRIEEWAS